MRKVVLVLTLVLVLLFSAFFMFPVRAEQWSTIQVPTPNLYLYGGPSISADGSKIAFSASDDGLNENAKIFVVNWDGTELKLVTSGSRINMYPSISGDGSKIAFYSYVITRFSGDYFVTSDPQIFVVNSNGTELRQLTWNTGLKPAPASPSISSDGSKIVFSASYESGQHNVFMVNADGTGLTQLTHNTKDNKSPAISGDGRNIAFVASSNDTSELFVVNQDGSGQTSPIFTAKSIGQPSVSTDGHKIAFSADLNGYDELFVVNSDGTGLTVTDFPANASPSMSADGRKIVFSSSYLFVVNSDGTERKQIHGPLKSAASISEDGSKIAFVDSWQLFVSVNLDVVLSNLGSGDAVTSNATRWSPPTLIASKMAGAFSLSADGSKIAFVSKENGATEIFIINSDGTGRKKLTDNPSFDTAPSISADGSKISFTSSLNGTDEIFVINSDGTNLTQVTTGGKKLWSYISGDGSKIVFLSGVSDDWQYGLFVVNADGTELKQITNNTSFIAHFFITNDGKKVVFTDSDVFGSANGLFTVNSDGTELKQLLPTDPDWLSVSGDGSKMVLLSNDHGVSEILVGDSNGTGLTSLTADLPPVVYSYDPPSIVSLFDFIFPSISADGSKIAFVSDQLFVVNSDGTDLTQVTNIDGAVRNPSLSADGSKIAFLSKAGDTEYDLYVATDLEADLNTDTPTPTPTPSVLPSNPEPFPTTLVATASAGTAVVIGAGLLVYFKKRKR